MREVVESKTISGNVDIAEIKINIKSRDEIDRSARGLQFLYINLEVRSEVFTLLEKELLPKVSKKNGNLELDLWKILVLGIMRQVCNWDFIQLHHMSSMHQTIREFMGHGIGEWGINIFMN